MVALGAFITAVAITVYAAGGSKKLTETCKEDQECSRGHCHKKDNGDKVCVDCSSSKISDVRGQIQRYCKGDDRTCDRIPKTEEASEKYFTLRIEEADRCITARKEENNACWNGGDKGHRDQVTDTERLRKKCYDALSTRKGNGGIYTCSDSTYASRSRDTDSACSAYGKACEAWFKDDKQVSCRDIEDAMKKADQCVDMVERLDSDCLPRLSRSRESQFSKAKKAFDHCKDVLSYKQSKKLCK